mgnify:CR=1 FL=1
MELAQQTFWNKTNEQLKSFVYARVRDKAMTEDIVQDVLVKVHTKVGQLKESEKLSGWIFQITRNAITDHFRSRAKNIQASDIDWEGDKKPLNDCVASCLGDMLATLPDKYREALEMTEFQNLSQTEFAERLNISYSGAKSRVQRARQMQKEKMDEAYLIKMDNYGNVLICENRVPCNCGQSNRDQ